MKDILELLKKHGGKVHGPHVETVSIPLDNFSTLIRKAVEEERAICEKICDDNYSYPASHCARLIRSRKEK